MEPEHILSFSYSFWQDGLFSSLNDEWKLLASTLFSPPDPWHMEQQSYELEFYLLARDNMKMC